MRRLRLFRREIPASGSAGVYLSAAAGGVATIIPDEFFNIYDKTGPGMSNYKP